MQPKLSLFIHQNMFLLLKCIEIGLGKTNYYLSHSNLESKKYLVNSEIVQVNFKLKKGIIERYKERGGSVLIILIWSVISYKLFIIIYNVDIKCIYKHHFDQVRQTFKTLPLLIN
jgi:hypothetical protein